MSVQILFSTGRTVISKAIRAITKSPVSHCGVLLTDADGLCGAKVVLAEDVGGFKPMLFSVFTQSNDVVRLFTPVVDLRPGVEAELPRLGAGYDYGALVQDGADVEIAKVAPWWHPRVWMHEPGAMFCSNVLVRMMQRVNYPGTAGLEPVKTEPAQLYSLCLAQDAKRAA
jgi:hypothetical protein